MDITIKSGIGLMRLVAFKSIRIRNFEINLVLATTISALDRHISLIGLRLSLGACPGHVACLLASVADALERTAATTAMSTPTATTSNPTSGVVDGLRTIAAFVVVRLRTTAAVAKAGLLLETLEEELLLCG